MAALPIFSGAHNAIVPRLMELIREKDMTVVKALAGGIGRDEGAEELNRQRVAGVFQPRVSPEAIVNFMQKTVERS